LNPHGHKTCPRCDSPLTGVEMVCPQCRMVLSGSKLAAGPSGPTICPICKIPLYEALFGGLPTFHCAECKGMGLKREVMMGLQPYGPKELEIGEEEKKYRRPPYFEPRQKPPFLICPICKKRMKEMSLSKMTVDLCENCNALWLEEPKAKYLNEMLGPYKWKVSKEKK